MSTVSGPRDGNTAAKRGDLAVTHVQRPMYEYAGEERPERDEFQVGQVTSITRDGLVKMYRPAGNLESGPDYLGRPDRGVPLPKTALAGTMVMSAKLIDVPGALATAACHVWEGHETQPRAYGSLDEVQAAMRPHLHSSPGWERLRDAAVAWEAARRETEPLLRKTDRARGEEFLKLYGEYQQAVAAANDTYRRAWQQVTAGTAA